MSKRECIDFIFIKCEVGYEVNGSKNDCVDIDECKTTACPRYSKCENTEGSYRCQCNAGYKPSGLGWVSNNKNKIFDRILRAIEDTKSYCVDKNECDENEQTCGANATCENYPGSYRCSCISGYQQISNSPYQCQDEGKFEIKTLSYHW